MHSAQVIRASSKSGQVWCVIANCILSSGARIWYQSSTRLKNGLITRKKIVLKPALLAPDDDSCTTERFQADADEPDADFTWDRGSRKLSIGGDGGANDIASQLETFVDSEEVVFFWGLSTTAEDRPRTYGTFSRRSLLRGFMRSHWMWWISKNSALTIHS